VHLHWILHFQIRLMVELISHFPLGKIPTYLFLFKTLWGRLFGKSMHFIPMVNIL